MKLKTLRLLIRDFLIIYQNPTKITETQEVLQWSGYVSCIGTCVQCPSRAIQWQLDVFHVSFSQVLAFALTLIITSFTSYSYIFLVTKKIHFFNYLRFSSSKIQLKIMSKFRHCLQEVYNRDDWGNLGAATEKAVDPLNTLKKVVIENTPILWSI